MMRPGAANWDYEAEVITGGFSAFPELATEYADRYAKAVRVATEGER